MKLQEEKIEIVKNQDFLESAFGISQADSAHILNILRSKLYSNKVLAVIREYCTNAQDAHVEAGKKDIPIKISAPTRLDPNFRVRDFGNGLSEDDIRNLYVMYGASTKRTSNAVVGQLGLGCKAAFAYSDKFIVTSWHQGERKVYCAYIDETKCGKIALMSAEPSSEPDGIQVEVPVTEKEYHIFHDELSKFLKFMEPTPDISDSSIVINKREYLISGTIAKGMKYGIHKQRGNFSVVIMGSIPYPIQQSALSRFFSDATVTNILDLGVDIWVPIGELDITASREELEYTQRTANSLRNYLIEAMATAEKDAEASITDAMSYAEANIRYKQLIDQSKFWSYIKKLKDWNGHLIDGTVIHENDLDPNRSRLCEICRPRHGFRKYNYTNSIPANENIIIIDTEKSQWKPIVKSYLEENPALAGNTYIINWYGEDEQERVANRLYARDKFFIGDYPMVKTLSDLKIVATKKASFHGPRSNSHLGSIFKLLPPSNRKHSKVVKSGDWEKVKDIPAETKYYVILDHFMPVFNEASVGIARSDFCNVHRIDEVLALSALAGQQIDTVYGVKLSSLNKVKNDPSWVPLINAIRNAVITAGLDIMISKSKAHAAIPQAVKLCLPHKHSFPKEGPISKMLNIADEILKAYNAIAGKVPVSFMGQPITCLNLTIDAEPYKQSLARAIEDVSQRYTLVSKLKLFPDDDVYSYNTSLDRNPALIPELIKYINLVDESQKRGQDERQTTDNH